MTKIPIILEQYVCAKCEKKWYVNTADKIGNKMDCPYGCLVHGNITRRFDMVINDYKEYAKEPADDEANKYEGGEE